MEEGYRIATRLETKEVPGTWNIEKGIGSVVKKPEYYSENDFLANRVPVKYLENILITALVTPSKDIDLRSECPSNWLLDLMRYLALEIYSNHDVNMGRKEFVSSLMNTWRRTIFRFFVKHFEIDVKVYFPELEQVKPISHVPVAIGSLLMCLSKMFCKESEAYLVFKRMFEAVGAKMFRETFYPFSEEAVLFLHSKFLHLLHLHGGSNNVRCLCRSPGLKLIESVKSFFWLDPEQMETLKPSLRSHVTSITIGSDGGTFGVETTEVLINVDLYTLGWKSLDDKVHVVQFSDATGLIAFDRFRPFLDKFPFFVGDKYFSFDDILKIRRRIGKVKLLGGDPIDYLDETEGISYVKGDILFDHDLGSMLKPSEMLPLNIKVGKSISSVIERVRRLYNPDVESFRNVLYRFRLQNMERWLRYQSDSCPLLLLEPNCVAKLEADFFDFVSGSCGFHTPDIDLHGCHLKHDLFEFFERGGKYWRYIKVNHDLFALVVISYDFAHATRSCLTCIKGEDVTLLLGLSEEME